MHFELTFLLISQHVYAAVKSLVYIYNIANKMFFKAFWIIISSIYANILNGAVHNKLISV